MAEIFHIGRRALGDIGSKSDFNRDDFFFPRTMNRRDGGVLVRSKAIKPLWPLLLIGAVSGLFILAALP